MGLPRWNHWSGLPFPPPGDLPSSDIEPASPVLADGFFTSAPSEKSWWKDSLTENTTHKKFRHTRKPISRLYWKHCSWLLILSSCERSLEKVGGSSLGTIQPRLLCLRKRWKAFQSNDRKGHMLSQALLGSSVWVSQDSGTLSLSPV